MTASTISFKINDSVNGIFATINLPEGEFHVRLDYKKGFNGRREWTVLGQYPKDKYSITYDGTLTILPLSAGNFEVGQKVTHKAFGKGVVISSSTGAIRVEFEKVGQKQIMRSIASNFMK